jgi:uncharacterized membrane protein YeaQ/YmgE (transglycosylase-associated protein family)
MSGIILWIFFGAVVGVIAKKIMPGNQNMGWLMTCALGIVGSIVGGIIAQFFGGSGASDDNMFHFMPIVFSVVGALIVLWIYGKVTNK